MRSACIISEEVIMNLEELGWNSYFQRHFEAVAKQGYIPARIARAEKTAYTVYSESDTQTAQLSGRLRALSREQGVTPVVGDWVAMEPMAGTDRAIIYAALPRKSEFNRKGPISGGKKSGVIGGRRVLVGGRTEKQVIAANIDYLFYVIGLDRDINLRLIERIITSYWDSVATLIFLLNKADICASGQIEDALALLGKVTHGAATHIISAEKEQGMDALGPYLMTGTTMALIGNSGVGKSTIINRLIGEDQLKTGAVREVDHKGRHTTSWREMIIRPQGGIIIDNPGMREMQIWSSEEDVIRTFADIEALAGQCRFRNCSHRSEPGCAILKAIEDGTLEAGRYTNYVKLNNYARYLEGRRKELR
jgi:ribosome biogenesis GTPase